MRYPIALSLSLLAAPAFAQNLAAPNFRTLSTTGNVTIGGTLTLSADPTVALQAATKQYVDAKAFSATFTGGNVPNATTFQATGTGLAVTNNATIGGTLTLSADPTVALQAATKQYVDSKASAATFTGGNVANATTFQATGTGLTVTNNATIGGTLTLSADPTVALQAATKQYVDSKSTSATFTGGNVANATTFQATGTALTVTNNASVGGTLTVTGTETINSLIHMAQPAAIQFDGSHTWSGSQWAVGGGEIYSYTNQSGTTNSGNPIAFHYFGIGNDTLQATNTGIPIANIRSDVTTGTGILGPRSGMYSTITVNGTPGAANQIVAGQFSFQASAPAFATGISIGYGTNPTCGINAAATGTWSCVGEEIDIRAVTGSTPYMLTGMTIVPATGHAVHGSRNLDSAISFGNAPGTSTGWDYGVRFGGPSSVFPFVSTATLIITWPGETGLTVASGIDFSDMTFTAYSLKMPSFSVDGAGNVIGTSYSAGATAGVSCAANTASLTTLVVTNGIVTHC